MKDNRVPYNAIPHYVASDYRSGKLKLNELILLLWLRASANPYGIATTSLETLREDIFPDLKKNTVNSVLLKLRQKHYVFFERRQGKGGSFDIKLGHWLTPDGAYIILDKFFAREGETASDSDVKEEIPGSPQEDSSESNQKLEGQNQKLEDARRHLIERVSVNPNNQSIRTSYNDNEHETEKENHGTLAFKGTLVRGFEPNGYDEEKCYEIAVELREEYMNPILNALRKDGLRTIEQAWGIFREHKAEGKKMDSPRKYFQGILNKLRDGYEK